MATLMFQVVVLMMLATAAGERQERAMSVNLGKASPLNPAEYKGALERFRFLQQPKNQVVQAGTDVEVFCLVDEVGGTEYDIKWYRFKQLPGVISQDISDSLLEGEKKGALYIVNVQPAHSGYYLCNVTMRGTSYSIVSNSGHLEVNYFEKADTVNKTVKSTENMNLVELECNIPEANPPVSIKWYDPMGKVISNEARKVVLPKITMVNDVVYSKGSLMIMYVQKSDEGTYTCKATVDKKEYELTKIDFKVNGKVQISDAIEPEILVSASGKAALGGRAQLFCAGYGYPAPNIVWSKDGVTVRTSDSTSLDDHNRVLTIDNVGEDDRGGYTCNVVSPNQLLSKKQVIIYLEIIPSNVDIKFISSPSTFAMFPNKYIPFTLKCSIDYEAFKDSKQSSHKPVMYWMKDGSHLQTFKRLKLNTIESAKSGKLVLRSEVEFNIPNETDQGVYQCIAQSQEQISQVTAHVNVRRTSTYRRNVTEKYNVYKISLPVDEAEETCQNWDSNGHLVSVMSYDEALNVKKLLEKKGITKAWIGLTSEDNHSPGFWKWTQPADNSLFFSYWYNQEPDNADKYEEYAIMDTEKDGRWLDVDKKNKFPFVCKVYEAKCQSVSLYFQGKVEPINKAENTLTTYGIGETVTIICRDKMTPIKQVITCVAENKFEPDAIACPVINSSESLVLSSLTLLALFLIII